MKKGNFILLFALCFLVNTCTFSQNGFYGFIEGSHSSFDFEDNNFNGAVGLSYQVSGLEVGFRSNVTQAFSNGNKESQKLGLSDFNSNLFNIQIADFWNVRVPLFERYLYFNVRMENFFIIPDHWKAGIGLTGKLDRVEISAAWLKKMYFQESNYEARISIRLNIFQPG